MHSLQLKKKFIVEEKLHERKSELSIYIMTKSDVYVIE